jgi:heme oxygenase
MTVTALTSDHSLSALLRTGSQAEHREAEGSSFMSELLAGRVDAAGYTHYLAMLRRVYEALETTAASLADDPIASVVVDPALDRLAALDADLAFWSDGPVEVESPSADRYVARIRESASWGGLFVAHHYTRYLGDLSGGQAIGRIISREFELDGEGVAFYDFAEVPKPKVYKDAYRARLDALPLDEAQRARVLEEVKAVFALNGDLFAELTTHLPRYAR